MVCIIYCEGNLLLYEYTGKYSEYMRAQRAHRRRSRAIWVWYAETLSHIGVKWGQQERKRTFITAFAQIRKKILPELAID